MINPDVGMCPSCKTHVAFLEQRIKVVENDSGIQEYAGTYKSCECGALTKDGNGVLNLNGEVAQAYGVQRRDPMTRILPKVRRKT